MNALSIVTFAIFLGLGGAALTNQQESAQSNTNATGPNPFMTFSAADFHHYRMNGYEAFGSYPVQHQVVHHHVEK
jgi:hypothetical protein